VFLVLALSALAAFGFLGMGLLEHNVSHICPFSVLSGSDCSSAGNVSTLVAHHISELQHLVQFTVPSGLTLSLLSLLLLVIVFAIFIKADPRASLRQYTTYLNRYISEKLHYNPNRKFLYWLALQHKRDPHTPKWVHAIT